MADSDFFIVHLMQPCAVLACKCESGVICTTLPCCLLYLGPARELTQLCLLVSNATNIHHTFAKKTKPSGEQGNAASPLTSGSSRRAPNPSKTETISAALARTARRSGVSRWLLRTFTLPRKESHSNEEPGASGVAHYCFDRPVHIFQHRSKGMR